jgi:diacylglycerol kinase (ATP)
VRSRSLLWSFNYAIEGIVYALRTQRNMRLHVIVAALVLFGALFLRIGRFEFLSVLFSITFVLIAELVNTAVEAAVDVATTSPDPVAKIAKDVAAGAVFVAAINAAITGYIVFFGRLTEPAELLLTRVQVAPLHVSVIAFGLTLLAALVGKALAGTRTWLHGGWPSGHTAIAFCIATAIAFLAGNAQVTVLAFFGAALVGQSRVESETHTIPQVFLGGMLGFLVTVLVFQVFRVVGGGGS